MKNNIKQISTNSPIQEFGHLIIADTNMKILGISEYALNWATDSIDEVVGSTLDAYLPKIFKKKSIEFLKIIRQVISQKSPRQIISKKVNKKRYYFKFTLRDKHLYIEWEEQLKQYIPTTQMNELSFLFESSYPHNWSFLCKAVNKLLHVDRVFILRIQESGYSKVLAEHAWQGTKKYHNKAFSEVFFPDNFLTLYHEEPYWYFPDLYKLNQKFYWSHKEPQPHYSKMFCLPKLHEDYLKNEGVRSVIFFPLMLNNEFWGLLVAQNDTPKKTDLQKRKLCSFVVQNAMNKYENKIKQGLLDFKEQIQEFEATLKERLVTAKTVNCAIALSMDELREMTNADGFAIYNQGDVFLNGACPTKKQFYELIEYLKKTTDKTIFKDNNFRLRHGINFSEKLPFAGLLSYAIGAEKDHYLIWFRKETIFEVTQVGVKKAPKTNQETSCMDSTIFHTWEKKVLDSAIPWNDQTINFIENLQRIINESIVSRNREREITTEKLLSLNNELEMFTFSLSHDLKNPLSILKMGLQFLDASCSKLPLEQRLRWYNNMLESTKNIEDIINNVIHLSQSRMTSITKNPIPMSYTIQRIASEAAILHNVPNCSFNFGSLLPIWGEKSALYQIFLNLIGNAVKYSSAEENPKVTITSFSDTKAIRYVIEDNGIGIPKDLLPNIFEMFSRASNANQFEGTGIGLSLVKRIMDRLGAEINIRSEENKGTEINLYFPLVSDFPLSMLDR